MFSRFYILVLKFFYILVVVNACEHLLFYVSCIRESKEIGVKESLNLEFRLEV